MLTTVLAAGCSFDAKIAGGDDDGGGGGNPGSPDGSVTTDPLSGGDAAPDEIEGDAAPDEAPWIPPAFTATRFAVFYQISADVLATYADPDHGVPMSPDHAYIFAVSHATAAASRKTADLIHDTRSDFLYAPCFDVNEHKGWADMSDAEIATMAHEFRDAALHAHADLFCYNEAVSTTGSSSNARIHQLEIFRHLADPDDNGAALKGVLFLTEQAATPSNWTSTGPEFWQAADETMIAVVAEHFHSQGFICDNSVSFLRDHLFALRRWFEASGDPYKIDIAEHKFAVLHSIRYAPGTSGWAGADSNQTSLAAFQRNLSKVTMITRTTDGGANRISYAPDTSQITSPGVQPRIAELLRWHYGADAPKASEEACVAGASSNCECQ